MVILGDIFNVLLQDVVFGTGSTLTSIHPFDLDLGLFWGSLGLGRGVLTWISAYLEGPAWIWPQFGNPDLDLGLYWGDPGLDLGLLCV